ncbi:MAG TPA: RluA family pseudouridine synthase [Kofleriaceae bacterium]|nr:RluA family pseudouridine synthase [Kofleriaceae bacterium]
MSTSPTTSSRAGGASYDGGGDGGDDGDDADDGDDGGEDGGEAGGEAGAEADGRRARAVYELPPGADPSIDWGLASHLLPDGTPRLIERHLSVPPELAGLRLDHFVKTQIPRLSRTKIQDVIATQLWRVPPAGPRLKPATIVGAGDRFMIRRPARAEPPCPRTFTLLHADARLLVVDKPALLPVHASAKFYFNTLTRVLAERFPDEPELQIAHRLDRETSGCLVVARDRGAAVVVKQAFATKQAVRKEYLAVVHGHPPWEGEIAIDVPLRLAQPGDPTRLPHVRMLPGPGGLPALTRASVLERAGEYALVRCLLVTGRQHQIRAHLAAVGYPIVGDKLYAHGDDAFIRYCDVGWVPDLAARFVLPRHALHAARVTFPHPDGGTVTAEAPLPRELAALLGR